MIVDDKTYVLIDSYIKDELSSEDILSFEKRLKEDEAFNSEYKTQLELYNHCDEKRWNFSNTDDIDVKKTIENIKQLDLNPIKQSISTASNSYKNNTSFNYKRLLGYAAGLIMLLGLGYFAFNSSKTSHLNLYAEYKAFDELTTINNRSEGTLLDISKGEKAFNAGQYEEALTIFGAVPSHAIYNSQLLIYKGLAHLELDQHQKALDMFTQLKTSSSLDQIKSNWYLALTYLKMNDPENVKRYLNLIVSKEDNYKYKEAKELLERL